MRIVERIKDAVEHTADSWQQKLLNEYNASEEPAARARKIISELVSQLDRPNQVIINDIVSLVYALASNPDPSVDLEQVVTTAEMLIHELVEPIPNPDKKLMDELLHIVVHASSHHTNTQAKMDASMNPDASARFQNAKAAATNSAQQQTAQSPPTTNTSTPQPTTVQSVPTSPIAEQPKPASSSSSGKGVDGTMVKLIMDEMKEVIKKNQTTEQRITDIENRLVARITAVSDDFQNIKDKLKKQEADLETINKNLDKFISLYEVVINQYNPFIEHIDEPVNKKETPAVSTSLTPTTNTPQPANKPETDASKQAAIASATQQNAESSESDIHVLIDKVKDMTDDAFVKNKDKTAKWITTVLKDQELASAFSQSATKAQAVKLLLSKSLA